jgi:hypothetical protein
VVGPRGEVVGLAAEEEGGLLRRLSVYLFHVNK